MHILLFLFLFIFTKLSYSDVQPAEENFRKGIEKLTTKDYKKAINIFEKLLTEGYKTPEVYNNLGNAYLLDNQQGKAILSYYRALRLQPEDSQIINNLQIVLKDKNKTQTEVIEPSAHTSILGKTISLLTQDQWAVVLIISCFCLCVIYSTRLFSSKLFIEIKLRTLSSFLWIVSCLALFCATAQVQYFGNNTEAIIISKQIILKQAPNVHAKDSFPLREGTKVRVLDIFEEWTKVEVDSGETAWIESKQMEII